MPFAHEPYCGFERPHILMECGLETADVFGFGGLCSQVATTNTHYCSYAYSPRRFWNECYSHPPRDIAWPTLVALACTRVLPVATSLDTKATPSPNSEV
jgi:hypothetical protein